MIYKQKATMINIILIIAVIILMTVLYFSNNRKSDPNLQTNTPSPSATIETTPDILLPIGPANIADINTGNIIINSRAYGNSFYVKTDDVWDRNFLKGVNIGPTLPTSSLTNPNISYDVYMSWFVDIAAMNSNTIKVYTAMNPDFYNALYDYNLEHSDNPLYLFQGVWINEDDMQSIRDAYGENEKIVIDFKNTAKKTVDVVNGNITIPAFGNTPESKYEKDITKYIVGWILGLEWDSKFIINTNENNPNKGLYKGKYLYTNNASPFEAFLCEVGDYLISYQSEKYFKQQPLAFLNWSTTDVLKHTNEPFKEEDEVALNTENILSTNEYYPGLFAAIDIYPYYPEFLNYQKEYINYLENGKPNPYRAYLKDLHKQYTVPMIVAEFGIPTSRAKAHESVMGFTQGGVQENEQGKMILKMMQDINKERYAGAMIFSWQDEWFKQTWNTFKFSSESNTQRASNVQSAEQFYGIVAYDPGSIDAICYPDGNLSEWNNQSPIYSNDDMNIYTKSDERYLYFAGRFKKSFDFTRDKIELALGTTGNGNTSDKINGTTFQYPTDYVISLNGKNDSHIYVDAAYDFFNYEYSINKKYFQNGPFFNIDNSGVFNPIKMLISGELYLPVDKKTIPAESYEAGSLVFGNANPSSAEYNSLSDFYVSNEGFEIRIPWYLINVIDPANKMIMNDINSNNEVNLVKANSFYIGGVIFNGSGGGSGSNGSGITMSKFDIPGYNTATFHKRLKPSYYILKDGMANIK